jgi:hypothetical protein
MSAFRRRYFASPQAIDAFADARFSSA